MTAAPSKISLTASPHESILTPPPGGGRGHTPHEILGAFYRKTMPIERIQRCGHLNNRGAVRSPRASSNADPAARKTRVSKRMCSPSTRKRGVVRQFSRGIDRVESSWLARSGLQTLEQFDSIAPRFGVRDDLLMQVVRSIREDAAAGMPLGPTYAEALAAVAVRRMVYLHSGRGPRSKLRSTAMGGDPLFLLSGPAVNRLSDPLVAPECRRLGSGSCSIGIVCARIG